MDVAESGPETVSLSHLNPLHRKWDMQTTASRGRSTNLAPHSPMVVFLPASEYKLSQDGKTNGPRKCTNITLKPECYNIFNIAMGIWVTWWWYQSVYPSLSNAFWSLNLMSCDPPTLSVRPTLLPQYLNVLRWWYTGICRQISIHYYSSIYIIQSAAKRSKAEKIKSYKYILPFIQLRKRCWKG